MHFVSREWMCERLRVSKWSSYGLIRPSRLHLVNTDDILSLLNRARRSQKELDFIPSDLLTADEVERELGIPSRKLAAWTRRRKNPPPHFRINKQITRYPLGPLSKWLERRAG